MKLTILLSLLGAAIVSVVVQQITYRNSMEFQIRSAMEQERSKVDAENQEWKSWCISKGRKMKMEEPKRLVEIHIATIGGETDKLSLTPDEERLSLCITAKKFDPFASL